MTVALGLLTASLVAPLVGALRGRSWALRVAAPLVGVGVLLDVLDLVPLGGLAAQVMEVDLLRLGDGRAEGRLLLLAALAWCGPAADLLVRRVLDATGLPAPEAAAAAGFGAGRWIGRLERWMLLLCVAAGQPALAVIPIGGKALFRYAEVVAAARAEQPRLVRADGEDGAPLSREALVDYVIVGSLASWSQAIALGLLVAAW